MSRVESMVHLGRIKRRAGPEIHGRRSMRAYWSAPCQDLDRGMTLRRSAWPLFSS
jgi:hypothetical protein